MAIDKRRKYTFNLEAFDQITREEQSYWLGFLVADGYLSKSGLSCELHQRDKNHLEKLNLFMKGNCKVNNTRKDCCRIRFNSIKLEEKLIKHGLIQNKTKQTFTPSTVPENLLKHFYRGIFDGDGWITSRKQRNRNGNTSSTNRITYEIGFSSGCEIFIKEIHQWICKELNKNVGYHIFRQSKNGSVHQLTFGGNNLFKEIIKILYDNPKIYLDRKYEKIKLILQEIK